MPETKRILIASVVLASLTAIHPLMAQNGGRSSTSDQKSSVGPNVVYKVGGDVSAPLVIQAVEPQYTASALNQKIEGSVLVNLHVDVNGNPNHIRVLRGLGEGLDEKAIEAAHHYKFKPAVKDGKAVPVELNLEIKFMLPSEEGVEWVKNDQPLK
jgi:TonB family protein